MNRGGVCVLFSILFSCFSLIHAQHVQGVDIQQIYKEQYKQRVTAAYLEHIEAILGKPFSDIGEAGIKFGIFAGIQNIVGGTIEACAAPLVQDIARPITSCIKYPFSLTYKWMQLLLFGSRRLAWNDVAKLNNTVFELIQPLTVPSLGDFTKDRRAELVAAKQDSHLIVDKDWQLKKGHIIRELNHVIHAVNDKAACYRVTPQENVVRKAINSLYSLFSVEQREEIAYWLENAAQYGNDMKNFLEGIVAAKQLEEHRDTLKFLLARALKSFKMIAAFINEDIASMPAGSVQPGYLKFSELSAQGSGSLAGLDALFSETNTSSPSN